MPSLVRRHVYLDSGILENLERAVKEKGGRRKGYSLSKEVNSILREHLRQQTIAKEEALTAPVWQQILDTKFAQLEAWLRPGVWGGATYSTTAALILLDSVCGKRVDPETSKQYFELLRSRAWKLVRKEPFTPRAPDKEEAS